MPFLFSLPMQALEDPETTVWIHISAFDSGSCKVHGVQEILTHPVQRVLG